MSLGANSLRILIAEDEEYFRVKLTQLLQLEGHEVSAASNGRVAHDLFCSDPFDLVISDISMPESDIDGLQLLELIRQKSNTRVILMTGFAYPGDFLSLSSNQPDCLLQKPFKIGELKQTITRCFERTNEAIHSRPLMRLSDEERLKLRKVDLDPETIQPQLRIELLIESGENIFELLCTDREPIPLDKVRLLQRLGLRIWTRKR